MSSTEREAIGAGSVGWEATLFRGQPDWRAWLDAPRAALTVDEQTFLDGPVETLCEQLDDWAITHQLHDLPPEVWHSLKHDGFFGLAIPKIYGGLEFSPLAQSAVVVKIASRSLSGAVTAMVPNSIGPAKLLLHYGTPEQKNYWLPRLASGDEIPCFALTGPTVGSDASAIPDTGLVCRRGPQLGVLLNWEKRYITLGPIATVLGLAFRLYDPDRLLGGVEGITLALVPTDTPGVTIGRRHLPLDQAFQNGPNSGRDVFIPLDNIIGGLEYAGQGWSMLMETLAGGRAISLPALAVGANRLCARVAGAYAVVRRQFNLPIGRFEGVGERLGRIAGNAWLTEAARRITAAASSRGEHSAVVSAILKQNLTERMRLVVNDAMDILAGKAIMMGPRNLLGSLYQAVPIAITVEGANILTRGLIIFGQGAVRCHPYLLTEMTAIDDPDPSRSRSALRKAINGHLRYLTGIVWRAATRGLTHAAPPVPTRRYYRQLNRLSAAFALVAEAALLSLRGQLKRRESLSGRLADAFSHLYLAACALKHYEDEGRRPSDLPLLDWSVRHSLWQVEIALDGVIVNLPSRLLAAPLRLLIFPLGCRLREPDDRLTMALAEAITNPGEAREAVTAGIYIPTHGGEALSSLEQAFEASVAAAPAEQKLRAGLRHGVSSGEDGDGAIIRRILSETEAASIEHAEALRREVLRVDDFPPNPGGETLWQPESRTHAV